MNNTLTKLGEKTYTITNPINIGIYVLDGNNVCVIDTGSSKDYAKMVSKILDENQWNLKFIINTHSHADHITGNNYLQNKYNCKIYSSEVESYFINKPILEPALMYGASPINGLVNHILCAKESVCENIEKLNCDGISIVDLKGHSAALIGIATSDNVIFVGDAYTSIDKIKKYSIQYTYDIDNYLQTIDNILNSNYNYYVPSHGNIENKSDAFKTIVKNKEEYLNVRNEIFDLIGKKIKYDDLVEKIFIKFNININAVQYYVIKASIKAYIASLEKEGKIELLFEDNNLFIESI